MHDNHEYIEQLIKSRRTIHSYRKNEVPADILRKALELSLWAPNHKMTRPWKFMHLTGPQRELLADITVSLKNEKESLGHIKEKALREKYKREGSLVFFLQKLSSDPIRVKEDFATLAASIQNFSLYLWSRNYGTKWSTGAVIRSEKTYQLLKIDPKEFEIVGMLWAGEFDLAPPAPERGELSEFLVTY